MAQSLSLSRSSGIYALPYVMSATPTNLLSFANTPHHPDLQVLKNKDSRINPQHIALSCQLDVELLIMVQLIFNPLSRLFMQAVLPSTSK